jgi:hypothetical protein
VGCCDKYCTLFVVYVSDDAVSISGYLASKGRKMINWRGLGRKRPWLKYAAIPTFDCKITGVPGKNRPRTFRTQVRSTTA